MTMREDILALPDHLRDALWKVESARLEAAEAAGVLICGMGGSAIGGDLAVAALAGRLRKPLLVVRGYSLPSWATAEWTVLCSSYSGDTEETVSCMDAAAALGARRIVATTGGALAERAREDGLPVIGLAGMLQPRAAVGYMLTVAAEVAALASASPRISSEIEAAAATLAESRDALERRAEQIAEGIEGSVPVIYGAGPTIAVARRWKCEINENAKLPAVFSELPEADHNEIEGWGGGSGAVAGSSAVFLGDPDQHPRERRRIELTSAIVAAAGAPVLEFESEGDTPTARLLESVMVGDLVSVELAERRGVEPEPVEVLRRFKQELGRR